METNRLGEETKNLMSGLKAAGQLVAKQTERTKLNNVDLPAAYRKLGQHVYRGKQSRDALPEQFDKIDDLEKRLSEIEATATTEKTAEGIGKLKTIARTAKATARTKMLQQKRSKGFAVLGKAAYERYGTKAGPEELLAEITTLRSRLEAIDAEIAELSQAQSGGLFAPKRLAIAAAVLFLVVGLLGISTLAFKGKSRDSIFPEWDQKLAKAAEDVKDADALWDSGQKEKAVEAYTAIIHSQWGFNYLDTEGQGDAPRIFSRVIDYKIEKHGPDAARVEIEKAVDAGASVTISSPEGQALFARLREEKKQRQREARERLAQQSGSNSGGSTRISAEDVKRLKLGMSPNEVIAILGQPDATGGSPGAIVMMRYGDPFESGKGGVFVSFARQGTPTGGVTMVQYNGEGVVLGGL